MFGHLALELGGANEQKLVTCLGKVGLPGRTSTLCVNSHYPRNRMQNELIKQESVANLVTRTLCSTQTFPDSRRCRNVCLANRVGGGPVDTSARGSRSCMYTLVPLCTAGSHFDRILIINRITRNTTGNLTKIELITCLLRLNGKAWPARCSVPPRAALLYSILPFPSFNSSLPIINGNSKQKAMGRS